MKGKLPTEVNFIDDDTIEVLGVRYVSLDSILKKASNESICECGMMKNCGDRSGFCAKNNFHFK